MSYLSQNTLSNMETDLKRSSFNRWAYFATHCRGSEPNRDLRATLDKVNDDAKCYRARLNEPYNVLNRNIRQGKYHSRFADLKKYTNFIAKLYADCGNGKTSERLLDCGSFIKFITDDNGRNPLCVKRFACHNRFCSICQFILSRQYRRMLTTIINALMNSKTKSGTSKYSFTFITPTVPNAEPVLDRKGYVDPVRTACRIRSMFVVLNYCTRVFLSLPSLNGYGYYYRSFNGHRRRFENKGRILGSDVKHELTINRNLSFNVHNHLVNIMHHSYYHGKYYLKFSQWRKLWNVAVKVACRKLLRSNAKHWTDADRYTAMFILGSQYLNRNNGGCDIFVQAPYYKKLVTYRNGSKHYKKITLSTHDNTEQVKHITSEMSKYQTKAQDFKSLLKHQVSKGKVLDVFSSVVRALKGTSHMSFTGLFKKYHKLFKKGMFDSYTYQSMNNIYYNLEDIAKYKPRYKSYIDYFKPLSDSDKLYIRYEFHVPTTYTKAEHHMNFNSKRDKLLLDRAKDYFKELNNTYYRCRQEVPLHCCKTLDDYERKIDIINSSDWVSSY